MRITKIKKNTPRHLYFNRNLLIIFLFFTTLLANARFVDRKSELSSEIEYFGTIPFDARTGIREVAISEGLINPGINLQGNGVDIISGDFTPATIDNTDFGTVAINMPSTKTYTIQNKGAENLTISSIALSGTDAANFVAGNITLPVILASGASATFTLTFSAAALGIKTATVTINTDNPDNSAYTFGVQATAFDNTTFIITWMTTAANQSINFPLSAVSATNMTINWGDGTVQTNLGNSPSHTYVTAGTYRVTVAGTYDRVNFNNSSSASKILSIEQWGTTKWSTMTTAFYACTKLQGNATDVPDLSNVTDMSFMFRGASIFNQNLNNWNVSNVINMSYMFYNAKAFNGNISSWNVSKVINMSYMFYNANAFNQNLNNWVVSAVTNMTYMFYSAIAFNGSIGNWNVSAVTNMSSMFNNASAFNGSIGNWNVSTVTNMSYMFNNASAFNGSIGNWNVSAATNMSYMFINASAFNQNLNNWNVSAVTSMISMFSGASIFNQDIGSWNVSAVTSMNSMFSGASIFNQDIGSWNVSAVTSISSMFSGASTFNQNISRWNVNAVTDMSYMFNTASAFNQDISSWNVSTVTNMNYMFYNAITFNQNLNNWDVSRVTSMNHMFDNASAFNGSIGSWNVSKVTNMFFMFNNASIFNQDISSWNVGNVISMSSMFQNAKAFNGNISNWNVSKVNTMSFMFYGASTFNQNISSWVVSAVTNMTCMFNGANAFNQNIGSWNVAKVTSMVDMFKDVTLSPANYDALLMGWTALAITRTVPFSGGNSMYCAGAAARQNMINSYSWSITDGGANSSEINLQGNTVDIVSGDSSPSLTDATDFGTVILHTPSIKTYTIQNTGTSDLLIAGITLSGIDVASFTLGGITLPTTIAALGSTTFTLTLNTATIGAKTASVTISNYDCNEGSYAFAITGIGISTTWTGANSTTWSDPGNWSANSVPIASSDVIIAAATNQPEIASSIAIHSLTIDSGASLTVPTGRNLSVTNSIRNSGTLTIENNANLIQVDDVANTGNTIVKRNSSPLLLSDYTLWSSPVMGQNLLNFSPLTLAKRFYEYNSAFGTNGAYSTVENLNTTNFTIGKGYLIRMPNNANATTPAAYPGIFTGVLNNGDVPISLTSGDDSHSYNLVGNPYPSPINISTFLEDNTSSIEKTLYFWRKTNGATGSAYCTLNNGVFTTNSNINSVDPNGIIQTGQGFFVAAKPSATSLTFKNGQRIANTANQFFKTKQVDSPSRIWLNATNIGGSFSQMAINYTQNATLGLDNFDGKYINDNPIALTSNINNEEYTIQGRPTFDPSDVVALNFKTDLAGNYTIALDHSDGMFAKGQDVYLADAKTGTEINLKTDAYTFAATAGIDNTRFSLKYQKTLKVDAPAFNENTVTVYKNKGTLIVKSTVNAIDNIKIFDLNGRLIAEQKKVNANTATIENFRAEDQVLIVQVTSDDKKIVNKKVIN